MIKPDTKWRNHQNRATISWRKNNTKKPWKFFYLRLSNTYFGAFKNPSFVNWMVHFTPTHPKTQDRFLRYQLVYVGTSVKWSNFPSIFSILILSPNIHCVHCSFYLLKEVCLWFSKMTLKVMVTKSCKKNSLRILLK